jgi:hypothetical protein
MKLLTTNTEFTQEIRDHIDALLEAGVGYQEVAGAAFQAKENGISSVDWDALVEGAGK